MFQVPVYPRQYHLAALRAEAAAKAAEAKWLAAEAIQQEEDSLKARLYDIEQQRKYSRPPTASRYGALTTYQQPPAPFLSAPPRSPLQYGYPSQDPYYSQPPVAQRRHILPSPSQDLEGLQARLKEEHQARIAAEKELRRKVSELEQVQSREVHPSAHRALAAQPAFHKPTATTARLGCLKSAPPAALSVNHPSHTSRRHDVEEILAALFGVPRQDPFTVKATPVPQKPACHVELPRAPIAPTNRPAAPETKPQNQINELLGALFGVPQQGTSTQLSSTIPDQPKANTNAGPVPQTSAPKDTRAAPTAPAPLNHPSNLGGLGESLLGDLRARYNAEHGDEVKDTVAAIIASLSDLSRTTEPAQSQLSRKSSIEKLQARYHAKEDDESRDILQATINSLKDTFGAAADFKAKGASLPSSNVLSSFQKVDNIEATFHNLEATFAFPTQLDFVPTSAPSFTPTNAFSTLAFTARNHPVRFYEQSLLALLTDLDLIESHGDTTLRTKRKEAVKQIEQALESLEQEIIGRWRSKVANEQTEGASSSPSRVPSPVEVVQGDAELESSEPQTKSCSVPIVAASSSSFTQPSLDETVEPEVAAGAVDHPTETDESDPIDASQLTLVPTLPETSSAQVDEATVGVSDASVDTESQINLSSASVSPSVSPSELPSGTIDEDEKSSALTREEIDILNDTFLLSQSEPEEKASKPSRKVEVEDLGSDWSDIDA